MAASPRPRAVAALCLTLQVLVAIAAPAGTGEYDTPFRRLSTYTYYGCFRNAPPNRVEGHIYNIPIQTCNTLAVSQSRVYFGMEWPQGYVTVGNAACLTLANLPSMVQVADSECEAEILDGMVLGSGSRLAVYETLFPTTTRTTITHSTTTSTTSVSTSTTSATATSTTSSTVSSTTTPTSTSTTTSTDTTTSTTSATTSTTTSVTTSTSTTTSTLSTTSTTTSSTTTSSTATTSTTTSSTATSSTSTSSTKSSTTSTTTTVTTSMSTTTPTTASTSMSTTTSTTASTTSSTTTSLTTSTSATTVSSTATSTTTSSITITTATWSTTSTSETTTSGTTVNKPPASTVLAQLAEAQESALLEEVLSSNASSSTIKAGDLTIFAVRLDGGGSGMTVPLEGTEAEVNVPASTLTSLGVDGAILLVTAFDPMSSASMSTNEAGSGGTSVEVKAAVNVNLATLSGVKLSVDGLEEPILITLPTNGSAGLQCAYWDEVNMVWATDGLDEFDTEEFAEGPLVCATTHLTLFAAIARGFTKSFLCSQVTLLTTEGVAALGTVGWYFSPAAWGFWVLLLVFALLLAVTTAVDRRRQREQRWTDEDFLIALDNAPLLPADSSDALVALEDAGNSDEEEPKGCIAGASAVVAAWVGGCVAFCHNSIALRDALDEVMADWFDNFGELRDFVEGMVEGVECGGTGSIGARVLVLVHRIMAHMLAASARRQAAASLGISQDASSFLLEDEEAHTLLLYLNALKKAKYRSDAKGVETNAGIETPPATPATPASQESGDTGNRPLRATPPPHRGELLGHLHDSVGVHLEKHMLNSARWVLLPSSIWRLFLWQNPFGSCMVHCMFLTSRVRALLFMVDVYGALMLATVFFQASGTLRGRVRLSGACVSSGDDESHPAEQIGRLLAVGVGSILISGIPAIVLGSLCTRRVKTFAYRGCPEWNRQLRAWRTQDVLIWLFALLYLGFCTFFIMLFLANVSTEDQDEWIISSAITVVLNTIVIPFFVAMTIPLLGAICLSVVSRANKVEKGQLIQERHQTLQREHANLNLPLIYI